MKLGRAVCGAAELSSEAKTSEIGGRRLLVCVAGTWWMCDVCERDVGWLAMCRVSG